MFTLKYKYRAKNENIGKVTDNETMLNMYQIMTKCYISK